MAVITTTQAFFIVLSAFLALVGSFSYGLANRRFYPDAFPFTFFGLLATSIFGWILIAASSADCLSIVGYGVCGLLLSTGLLSLGFGVGTLLRDSQRKPQ